MKMPVSPILHIHRKHAHKFHLNGLCNIFAMQAILYRFKRDVAE